MSERIREEIDLFVADLKKEDEKISWKTVSARCKEKFPNLKDVSMTANAIRKRFNASVKRSGCSEHSENSKESGMISAEVKEQLRQELLEAMEDYVEERVRLVIERVSTQVAERVFKEKMTNFRNVPILDRSQGQGYPPAPPLPQTVAGSRRHAVQRGKIAGTLDAELLELFERERKERGCSASRMLDIAIWNYFGKPKLSFELSEHSDNKA